MIVRFLKKITFCIIWIGEHMICRREYCLDFELLLKNYACAPACQLEFVFILKNREISNVCGSYYETASTFYRNKFMYN